MVRQHLMFEKEGEKMAWQADEEQGDTDHSLGPLEGNTGGHSSRSIVVPESKGIYRRVVEDGGYEFLRTSRERVWGVKGGGLVAMGVRECS